MLVLQACQAVRSGLAQGQCAPQLSRSLFGITDVVLSAHAAAVTAAVGSSRGGEGGAVVAGGGAELTEYRSARSRHVPPLLQDAVAEDEAAAAAGGDAAIFEEPLLPQVWGGREEGEGRGGREGDPPEGRQCSDLRRA